jgi:hypothetical protein
MMRNLARRGEELARVARERRLGEVARRLASMFGSGAVEAEEARVLVRGKGMVKRWLIDPRLRFLK